MKYLLKGRLVYVDGPLEDPYSYIDNQGSAATKLTINANNVTFLSGVLDNDNKKRQLSNDDDATTTTTKDDAGDSTAVNKNETGTDTKSKKEERFTPVEVPEDELPF